MKLTILNRLKLCIEILIIKSGYEHTSQEKQLSTFIRGYSAGRKDIVYEFSYAKHPYNNLVENKEKCNYPDCKCPFDMLADNKCFIGLDNG